MARNKKGFFQKASRALFHSRLRREVANRDFTIISNNEWGEKVYRDLGMKYTSPFIGMHIYAPDYLRLLENFEFYMGQRLKFTLHSKYGWREKNYPIGLLGEDVEIHFHQYKYRQEALEKWNERVERINWDNLFFKLGDQYRCTAECIERFDELPLKNKVCFTAKPYGHLKSVVYFSEQKVAGDLENEQGDYQKYFDLAKWLNSGEVVKKTPDEGVAFWYSERTSS